MICTVMNRAGCSSLLALDSFGPGNLKSKTDATRAGWECRLGTRQSTGEGKCNVTAALTPRDTWIVAKPARWTLRARRPSTTTTTTPAQPPPPLDSSGNTSLKSASVALSVPRQRRFLRCYSSSFVALLVCCQCWLHLPLAWRGAQWPCGGLAYQSEVLIKSCLWLGS